MTNSSTPSIPSSQKRRRYCSKRARLGTTSTAFFVVFRKAEGRSAMEELGSGLHVRRGLGQPGRLSEAYRELCAKLAIVGAGFSNLPAPSDATDAIARRSREIADDLAAIMEAESNASVDWYECRGKGVYLWASPISVAPLLRERLFPQVESVLLTSATLATGGKFDFIRSRLGMDEARELILGSHYDFSRQAILYVPRDIPEPRDSGWLKEACRELEHMESAQLAMAYANLQASAVPIRHGPRLCATFLDFGSGSVINMEALRVDNLSKDFGGVHALSSVSFGVETGERLVVIGPNGAGKTTLFNVINGQLTPTSGRVFFFERDITNMSTHQRAHLGQARSFQIVSLFLNLTVLDNALIALHGTKPSRFQMFWPMNSYRNLMEEARKNLDAGMLWEKREEGVKNLSHGEQRRLEIALSLAQNPKLLLLDEPSSGLTRDESSEVIGLIKNLGTRITVLIVDHDMNLVFGVADRIIVLHYGQVIADGTPEVIRDDPRVREIYMGMEECIDHVGVG